MSDFAGETVGARLRRLEDLDEIGRLVLDYGRYLDAKDFAPLSQLFASIGEFVAPFGSVQGPKGVLRLMNGMLGEHLAAASGQDFHVFANPMIELDRDRARGTSMWLYVTPDHAGYPQIAQFGHYEDAYVRENGRWTFERRDAKRDVGIPGGGVPRTMQDRRERGAAQGAAPSRVHNELTAGESSGLAADQRETAITTDGVKKRLQRHEHMEAIRELQIAYGRCLDAKDWEAFSQLFTETGEIVAGLGTTTGPQAIRDLFRTALKDVAAGFHVFTNLAIELGGSEATTRSLWLYLCADENGWPRILQFGHYKDRLVAQRGTWKFQRREATRDIGFRPYKP